MGLLLYMRVALGLAKMEPKSCWLRCGNDRDGARHLGFAPGRGKTETMILCVCVNLDDRERLRNAKLS